MKRLLIGILVLIVLGLLVLITAAFPGDDACLMNPCVAVNSP